MSTARDEADQRAFARRPRQGSSYRSTWGGLEVSDPVSARRSGMTRYRLEIFPPGTNADERRGLLRFRQWRLWGALVALVGSFLIEAWLPGWQWPLYVAVAYVAGLIIGLHLTSDLRRATRTLTVATIALGGSTYVEGDLGLLESCVTELEELDSDRRGGSVTPLAYELAWSGLYGRLEPARVSHESRAEHPQDS
jgi:MFS family permease